MIVQIGSVSKTTVNGVGSRILGLLGTCPPQRADEQVREELLGSYQSHGTNPNLIIHILAVICFGGILQTHRRLCFRPCTTLQVQEDEGSRSSVNKMSLLQHTQLYPLLRHKYLGSG